MAKYLLIAAVLISLATAGIGYVNHNTLVETKETLASTQTTLKGTQVKLTSTEGELKTTKATLETTNADKEKLASDLNTTKSELDTTKGELDTAKKESADSAAKVTSIQAELDDLKTKLHPDGQDSGQDAGKMVENLNQQIQEKDAALAAANDQNKGLVAQVAAFKKEADDRRNGLLKKGLEGRVLAVNPAWNFVVLSIGDKQGVSNNSELLIKRGGEFLGKVRITSVEPSTSIADIVANSMPSGVSVQPGDSVIFVGGDNN